MTSETVLRAEEDVFSGMAEMDGRNSYDEASRLISQRACLP